MCVTNAIDTLQIDPGDHIYKLEHLYLDVKVVSQAMSALVKKL